MTLPNFLYVGMSKAASTYIYEMLKQHPDVYVPILKDIFFFDREWNRGTSWYESHFSSVKNEKSVGEVSHDYWLSEEACHRIKSILPDVKLLVCLREPLDWLQSKYLFESSRKKISQIDILSFFHHFGVKQELAYAHNLRRLYQLFGKPNVHLFFYDQLCSDPAKFCRKIYSAVGVSTDFQANNFQAKILPAHNARYFNAALFAQMVSDKLRRAGLHSVLGYLKHNKILHSLIFTENVIKPILKNEERAHIIAAVRPEIEELANLIDEELPANWLNIYKN